MAENKDFINSPNEKDTVAQNVNPDTAGSFSGSDGAGNMGYGFKNEL